MTTIEKIIMKHRKLRKFRSIVSVVSDQINAVLKLQTSGLSGVCKEFGMMSINEETKVKLFSIMNQPINGVGKKVIKWGIVTVNFNSNGGGNE